MLLVYLFLSQISNKINDNNQYLIKNNQLIINNQINKHLTKKNYDKEIKLIWLSDSINLQY